MNARIALCAGGALLCATAASIFIAPERVAGQAERNENATVNPVRQVQYASAPVRQESEVQRQLRLLYAKDGKEMPEMDIHKLPMVQKGAAEQNRIMPSTHPHTPNSPLDYLKKLLPFGRSSSTSSAPRVNNARPLYYGNASAPRYGSQPSTAPAYMPQPSTSPRYSTGGAVATQPGYATSRPAGIPATAASSSRAVSAPNSPPTSPSTIPAKSAGDDIPVLIDERDAAAPTVSRLKKAPSTETTPAFPQASARAANEKTTGQPSPFPSSAKPAPAKPVTAPRPADNPFTGKSLADDKPPIDKTTPATAPPAPASAPVKIHIKSFQDLQAETKHSKHPLAEPKPLTPAARQAPQLPAVPKSSREDKLRLIVGRRGMTGFRGFCPVVLREQRELADSKLQFQTEYGGETYYFSSATAKAAFEQSPEKYAPASKGLDVVALDEQSKSTKGSLEHAVWFRGRIYLFAGADTLRKFVKDPKKYAVTE